MKTMVLAPAIAGLLLLASCKPSAPPSPPPTPVNLFTVKAEPVTYYDRYTSTTVAVSQVNLLPEVQGYITGIFFKEGTHVKKGQKLYEIDKRIYEDNYNTAAANQKVAEGNLKQAQQDADRYQYLNSNKAVAKQLYDHAMIALENAQSAYQSATEAMKIAKTNLAYSTIDAPFDGTVGFSQVKLGDLVTTGQTVLLTISSDDPMAVDFLINEKQLAYFEGLQRPDHQEIDSLFTIILPNGALYSHTGTLSVIDRAVNPQTGSIRIRLLYPNPKLDLRAGMSCVVRVHNIDVTPQLVVPNKAVVEEMGEYFVFVAKDSSVNGGERVADPPTSQAAHLFAYQKKVQLGAVLGPNILIKEGISEGDVIVSDGIQSLHNGSPIAPTAERQGGQTGRGSGNRPNAL